MPPPEAIEETIRELIRAEDWGRLRDLVAGLHPADTAEIINSAPSSAQDRIFSLVDDSVKPDVLAELESVAGTEILESLSNHELSEIVEEMSPDDAADLLGEMPKERTAEVLNLMEEEGSEDLRRLMEYDEDTAGGIMTTDVVAMREDQTVEQALEAISGLDPRERFYSAYIVDAKGRLIGAADVWALLRERNKSRALGELAQDGFTAATVDMDQEEVAYLLSKYDLNAMPVVDEQGKLVGRITADDVIDVLEEEATEDIFRLAGSDDAELENSSTLKSCAIRLPWLLVTLLGGFVVSVMLRQFHARIYEVLVLAAFVPVVLAMGGNTGIQSSTLVIRSIALGTYRGRSILQLVLREIAVGAIMGTACGIAIGLFSQLFILGRGGNGDYPPHLAWVVGVALFASMTFAAMFGALVPIVLNRLRIDPAVASGPFITITNDIAALAIYFGVTMLLVQGVG